MRNCWGRFSPRRNRKTYAALQEERRQNQIESRALRRLADLQTQLYLSEEQRGPFYDLLHAAESARAANPSNPKEDYQAFVEAGGRADEWSAHHAEVMQAEREQRVEQASGVLNERQLEAYRTYLERRGGYGAITVGGRAAR